MIQRSPTHMVPVKEAQRVYAIYAEGMPTEDCDLLATAMPFPELTRAYRMIDRERPKEIDRPLLERLAARGFRLDDGDDDCGFQMLYLQRGGGYYFNVGCSELIVYGEIGLVQYGDVDTLRAGRRCGCSDGSVVPAELLVLATGYKNQQEIVRAASATPSPTASARSGASMRVASCATCGGATPQPGLWFTAGSLAQCRIYSQYLALQIKALEEGLLQ